MEGHALDWHREATFKAFVLRRICERVAGVSGAIDNTGSLVVGDMIPEMRTLGELKAQRMLDLVKGRVTIYLSPAYRRFPVPAVSYLHEER
eukprot:3392131-Prymnesium_polylepis.1